MKRRRSLTAVAPPVDEAQDDAPDDAPDEAPDEARGARVFEADVDGARVKIFARDEVVIACGPASITLRRNGRVVIRGTYVETRSAGTNRIRGGQVRVN